MSKQGVHSGPAADAGQHGAGHGQPCGRATLRALRAGAVAAALAVLAGAGCGTSSSQRSTAKDEYSPLRERGGPVARNPSTMLKDGSLPLAYLFRPGGRLRIVDATAKSVLLRATIEPGALVAISESEGVLVGGETMLAGPLPPDHRYEIWWDSQAQQMP